jgi:hypothetical protein
LGCVYFCWPAEILKYIAGDHIRSSAARIVDTATKNKKRNIINTNGIIDERIMSSRNIRN